MVEKPWVDMTLAEKGYKLMREQKVDKYDMGILNAVELHMRRSLTRREPCPIEDIQKYLIGYVLPLEIPEILERARKLEELGLVTTMVGLR